MNNYLTVCKACGQHTTKRFARYHVGKCAACYQPGDLDREFDRQCRIAERIIDDRRGLTYAERFPNE